METWAHSMGLLFLSSRNSKQFLVQLICLDIHVLICETGMKKIYCAGIFKLVCVCIYIYIYLSIKVEHVYCEKLKKS